MSSSSAQAVVALAGAGMRDSVRSSRLADRTLDLIYVLTFAVAAFLVLTPLIALVFGSLRSGGPGQASDWTLANWEGLGTSGVLGTLVTTCAISAATAVLSTIGGAIMAWIVARTDFRHKTLVTTLTGLSFCFPGFILAMAWIIIGSPGGLLRSEEH